MTMVRNITRQSFLARRNASPKKTNGNNRNIKEDNENKNSQMITDNEISQELRPVREIDHRNEDEFPDLLKSNT